ncbi:MAG: fibronectin type III domain-containing protein [Bacteroidales bacterium]|nr:fibronectin type III domain-containing protein [Bacteroidales bacterium]
MKKRIVSLLFAIITTLSLSLQAQTLTSTAPNGTFTASDIEYWVGEGSNETALIIIFNNGLDPYAWVIGYRFSTNSCSMADVINAAIQDGQHFLISGNQNSGWLNNISYDADGDGVYEYTGAADGNWGMFLGSNLGSGFFSNQLTANSWGAACYGQWYGVPAGVTFKNPTTAEYVSVPGGNDACPKPLNFAVSSLTSTTASCTWEGANEDFDDYYFYYKPTAQTTYDSILVNGVLTYTLTELTPNTEYTCWTSTICEDENGEEVISKYSTKKTFRTACSEITELPYIEDFDNHGTSSFPLCWTKVTTNDTYPLLSNTHKSGTKSLCMSISSGTAMAVTSAFDESIDISNTKISFWKRRTSNNSYGTATNEYVLLGVMTNPSDEESFETIATITFSDSWTKEEIRLDELEFDTDKRYLALKSVDNGNRWNYFIDNFSVSEISNCEHPIPVSALASTEDLGDVTVSWTPASETDNAWIVGWQKEGDTEVNTASATTNPYTITGLALSSKYKIFIKTDCGNGEVSDVYDTMIVKTPCGQITSLPYYEKFELPNTNNDLIEQFCWGAFRTNDEEDNSSSPYIAGLSSYDNTIGYVVMYAGATDNNIAALPTLSDDIDITSTKLSFYIRTNSTNAYPISIGVLADATDSASFETVKTLVPLGNSGWHKYEVSFLNYNGEGKTIAFRVGGTMTVNMFLDEVTLTYIPECEHTYNLTATPTETPSSVTVTWTKGNESDNAWVLYYKAEGETAYTSVEVNGEPTYTLTNLPLQTNYTMYVKTSCEDSETDAFETINYRTPCGNVTTLPYVENFDTYGTSSYNHYVFPDCWTLIRNGNTPNVNASHITGIASLYMNTSANNVATASTSRLSDDIDMSSLKVTFFAKPNTAGHKAILGVMTNPEDITTFDTIKVFPLPTTTWIECEATLEDYEGEGRYITFMTKGTAGSGNSYYLDSVVVDYIPDCERPNTLIATQGESGTKANISWQKAKDTDNEWYVYYKKSISAFYDDSVLVSEQPNAVIENLDLNTQYDFVVRTRCGLDENNVENLSLATPPISYKTPCYDGAITEFPYTEGFEDGIDCFEQVIEAGTKKWVVSSNYRSLTNPEGSHCATFTSGGHGQTTMLITPTFDFSNIASATLTFKHAQEAWSPDQDVLMLYYRTDPTENWTMIQMWEDEITSWQEETVVLPEINGATEYQLGFEAVGDYGRGIGLDDLQIEVDESEPEPTCETPTNFRVDTEFIGDHTATLYWNTATAYQFVVYYRPVGSEEDFEAVDVVGNLFLQFENLEEGTTYECYMKAKCSETNLSEPTQTITFTTTEPTPDAPQIADEDIIAWAKGVEVYTTALYPTGRYYNAIGEPNTTDYVTFLNGTAKITFNRPIINGEGNDFVIFGNNANNGHAWVEVSSNGEDFFRFTNKTASLPNGYGSVFDINDLEDNEHLDKNNIRVIRLVDDGIGGGYGLAGVGLYNAGEEYLVADFEDDNFLTTANTYEIISQTNYTRLEEDEEMETTYFYKDNISAGLNFPGTAYFTYGWFMAMGFGPSNGINSQITGNGGTYVSPDYYVSSAEAGIEGVGSTYMQAYYDGFSMGMIAHNEVYRDEEHTFIPNGVYVSHSKASYSYTGSTNDYTPGYHKVVATGYDANDQVTGTASVYLTQTGTAYKDWKYLDLTALGEVKKVRFTLESNYANSYGLLIPAYFCLDNFTYTDGNEIEIPCTPTTLTENITVCNGESAEFRGQTLIEGENQITVVGQGNDCDTIYTVTLTVLPQITATETITVCYGEEAEFRGQTLTEGENQITVAGQENDCDTLYTVTLVVREENVKTLDVAINPDELPYQFGTQSLETDGTYTEVFTDVNGCDSTVTINLTINSGINEVENEINVMLYPNPATNNTTLSIQGLSLNAIITISDVQGKTLARYDLLQGQETLNINLSSFESGVYYVRITSDGISKTEKLIVK